MVCPHYGAKLLARFQGVRAGIFHGMEGQKQVWQRRSTAALCAAAAGLSCRRNLNLVVRSGPGRALGTPPAPARAGRARAGRACPPAAVWPGGSLDVGVVRHRTKPVMRDVCVLSASQRSGVVRAAVAAAAAPQSLVARCFQIEAAWIAPLPLPLSGAAELATARPR